jgi:hypothetical protein
MVDNYAMEIVFENDSLWFKDGNLVRSLKCPESRLEEFHRETYFFSIPTRTLTMLYNFSVPTQNTKIDSILAGRIWQALWMDGWRENPPLTQKNMSDVFETA